MPEAPAYQGVYEARYAAVLRMLLANHMTKPALWPGKSDRAHLTPFD